MSEPKKISNNSQINSSEKQQEKEEAKAKSDEKKAEINDLSKINFQNPKTFFIAKRVSNFGDIYKNFNGIIKSIVIKSNEIVSKLNSEKLSLSKCRELAKEKMKIMKTKEDVYLTLSYDNTNEIVLFNYLKRLNEHNINKLNEYKYYLPNFLDIIDKDGKINLLDIESELNYKFIFDNVFDLQTKLENLLKSLFEISKTYREYQREL